MKRIAIILFFIIYAVKSVNAQCPEYMTEPPTLSGVEVKATVNLDEKTGIYTYSYKLKNGKDSTGCIWLFKIDITYPPGGIILSSDGLVDYPKYVSKGVLDDPNAAKMIPVAFPTVPVIMNFDAWGAGLTLNGEAHWGANDPFGDRRFLLSPGGDFQGFVMTTYGLPVIRDFIVEPDYIGKNEDIYKMGASKEELNANPSKYIQAFYDSIAFKGKTLGPTAPPALFVPVDFLDHIISLKHDAYNLGWIIQSKGDDKGKKEDEEKGIMKSLDKKLEDARKELTAGDTQEAIAKLKSFIHEVEALYKEDKDERNDKENEKAKKQDQRLEHITSEAYALLKFNAEYLIEQLGGEKKKEDETKKE